MIATMIFVVVSMVAVVVGVFSGIIWMSDKYGPYWTKEWVIFGIFFFIGMCVYFRGLVWIAEHS